MSGIDQTVDTTTPNKIASNVSTLKQRVIATNKLLRILTGTKEEIGQKAEKITAMEAESTELKQQLAKKSTELQQTMTQKNSLAKQLATFKSSNLQSLVDNLQSRLLQAEASNANHQKDLDNKNMYIQQLEAMSEQLKEDSTVNKHTKSVEKHRQEVAKKNEIIKSLQDKVAGMGETINDLNKKLENSEEELEKLDMEYMELKTDVEMSNDTKEDDALQQKVKELEDAQLVSHKQLEQLKATHAQSIAEKSNLNKLYEASQSKCKKLLDSNKELNSITSKYQKLEADYQSLQKNHGRALQEADAKKRSERLSPKLDQTNSNQDQISPALLNKLRHWKSTNAILKDENKYLKNRVAKLNMKLNKNQKLEDLLQTTSSEEDNISEEFNYVSDSTSETSPQQRHPAKTTSDQLSSFGPSISQPTNSRPCTSRPVSSHTPPPNPTKPASSTRPVLSPKASSRPNLRSSPVLAKMTSPIRTMAASKDMVTSPARRRSFSITSTVPSSSSPHSQQVMEDVEHEGMDITPPPRRSSASRIYIPPPTRPLVIPKSKKPTNKLVKFANSRNPSKVINSKPIINPIKKRPATVEAPIQEDMVVKRPRLDTRFADQIKSWVKDRKNIREDDLEIDDILKEVFNNYSVMKSISDPDPKGMSKFGIEALFEIEVPDKWDGREKSYAWILSFYASKESKKFDYIYNEIIKEFSSALKSKRSDVSTARYCRLLCILCKSNNCIERIRTICYDVVRYSSCYANTIVCLFNVACGWSQCLTLDNQSTILLTTLQSCAAAIMGKPKMPENTKAMYHKMSTSCHWPPLNDGPTLDETTELVLQRLLAFENMDDKSALEEHRFEIVKSFELIFHVIGDWKKMYNEFILNKLWPLLTKDVIDDLALETMAVLGTFGLSQDPLKEDQPGVQHLFDIMIQVANVDVAEDDGKVIQSTATRGACMLATNNPARTLKVKQNFESAKNT